MPQSSAFILETIDFNIIMKVVIEIKTEGSLKWHKFANTAIRMGKVLSQVYFPESWFLLSNIIFSCFPTIKLEIVGK